MKHNIHKDKKTKQQPDYSGFVDCSVPADIKETKDGYEIKIKHNIHKLICKIRGHKRMVGWQFCERCSEYIGIPRIFVDIKDIKNGNYEN